jgi:hypothetical protein
MTNQSNPFSIPSTFGRAVELCHAIKQATIKAINENRMLHRDKSGEIHVDHPSSTGLYHSRPVQDILPTDEDDQPTEEDRKLLKKAGGLL